MSSMPSPAPVPLPPLASEDRQYATDPAQPDGTFRHPWQAPRLANPADVFRWKVLNTNPLATVKRDRTPWLPAVTSGTDAWNAVHPGFRVQWLGHASFLVELEGVHVLIDPVFGSAGPGVFRAVPAPRLPDRLPHIDLIVVTHGHYDHLDRGSIDAVCRRNPEVVVVLPVGQKKSLPRSARTVVELSWFQSIHLDGVEATLTPAQHWHLRRPWDRNRALWSGVMLRGPARADGHRPAVYHSGDTGWFDGFRIIREVLGAPDVALLPLGAYEPRWFMGAQHMAPEDAVRAFIDLEARHLVGMHWGTYDLSDEPIDHGPRTIIPPAVERAGLALDQIHILAHGGVLGLDDAGRVRGVAGRQPLPMMAESA
jgi:N-acyl-phosphatidylethanolamine-hydrolysing phospholipase D